MIYHTYLLFTILDFVKIRLPRILQRTKFRFIESYQEVALHI